MRVRVRESERKSGSESESGSERQVCGGKRKVEMSVR